MLSEQCAFITLCFIFIPPSTTFFPPSFEEGASCNTSIIQHITESQTMLGWKGPTRRKKAENEAPVCKLSTVLAQLL